MTPRQALETVIDADHADAVLDHRKAKRSPLTLRAAQLLAKEFAKCPSPNDAADEMLIRGWQGFKAEWVLPKQMASQALSVGSVFGNLAAQMESSNGIRRLQCDEGIREAFPLLSVASDEPKRS